MIQLALAYDWLRGLHIAAVIFWMAGLLYLPRLFIYQFKAQPGGELEETLIVQQTKLLKIIMNPAMIAAWLFGVLLILANVGRSGSWEIFGSPWWSLKFLGVIAMTVLHMIYAGARKRFAAGERPKTEKFWRMINEVPALLTLVIVLTATVALR